MAEQSLKDRTAKGLFWGGISNSIQQALNLIFGIFLARLLNDSDYGMVGMLTIFSLIAGSLQESGFIAALVNKKNIKHEDYNAVFWFCSGISLVLYVLLYACAPLIAAFYGNDELTPLARYTFIGFFISSLGIAHSAFLFRNLMVKQRAISYIIALIVSGTSGIILAYNGFSYWGIATQNLIYILITNGCFRYFSKWRPSFHFNFSPLKSMIGFSSKLLLTNIFCHINNNIFSIILGKYYSEKEVGQFNQANKWNYIGHSFITGMVNNVAQPVFSHITDDRLRQQRAFRKLLRFTSFISFPAMFGISLIAPEMITIAITDKWLPSAHILQILAIGGAFLPIATLYSNLLISKGKSDIYMWNTILLGTLQLIVMFLLNGYGIRAMLLVYISINILWLLVWHYFVQKEIDYSLSNASKDILPFAGIALLTMLVTSYATQSIVNIYLLIVLKILIAAAVYITIMWATRSKIFKECIQYLRHKSD